MYLSELIKLDSQIDDVLSAIQKQKEALHPLPLIVNGLASGARESFVIESIRELQKKEHKPALVFAQNIKDCLTYEKLFNESGLRTCVFKERPLVYYEFAASHELERERLFVLSKLIENLVDVVITTPAAAIGYTIPKERLQKSSIILSVGKELELDTLQDFLVRLGYARQELVETQGQFARRGGIIDIWANEEEYPVRLEFFDTEIDRMCTFDPITQRVLLGKDQLSILPAHEVLLDEDSKSRIRRHLKELTPDDPGATEVKANLNALDAGEELLARDRFLSFIYPEKETLFSYFDDKTPLFVLDTNEVNASLDTYRKSKNEERLSLKERKLWTTALTFEYSEKEYAEVLAHHIPIHLNTFLGASFPKDGGLFGYRCKRLPTYVDSPKALQDDLTSYLKEFYRVILLCDTKQEAVSSLNYCLDFGFQAVLLKEDAKVEELVPQIVYISYGALLSGYELITPRVAILSLIKDPTLEHARALRQKKQYKYERGQEILSYNELKPGDLVVHEHYGIGRFLAMEAIAQDGILRDYIRIEYNGSQRLLVPADKLSLITRYIGKENGDESVHLSTMGSTAWHKAKEHAKAAAKEMANELIQLYAARQRKPGIYFAPSIELEEQFAQDFPYELTPAQEKAIQDIYGDMQKRVPMDRLLCGDVGFGKTEVALRAAFRAVDNGYQVAILAPTTILAMQHYQTISARMRHFPVHVELLSRMQGNTQKELIYRRIQRGESDIVVGTHALLNKHISFKKLGLLVIDEEQRFGVSQKEKIKQLAQDIDVLTLSATPIPRTLNMAMTGIRDLSLLDEAPGERKPVQTYVLEYREDIIYGAIRKELLRSGQVLYLYNRTEDIDLVAGRIQTAFPGARVAFAHGQMEQGDLEYIWGQLVQGQLDILVCTTIVETGIDLPNANTLIIENADHMGLSQLHQLRGRIGRSSRQAYAYFTYRRGKVLSDISKKRLSAIRDYAEFGAGFRIALRDMELRGAGDLLGTSQHGHIETIGYDLYMKILNEAVLEEQGKPIPKAFETVISIPLSANIPESYIASNTYRLEMYKKIALIQSQPDLDDILDEFFDRFGDPPVETQRLLYISLIRAIAMRLRMPKVALDKGVASIRCEKPNVPVWAKLFSMYRGFRPPTAANPMLTIRLDPKIDPTRQTADLLKTYENLVNEPEEASI